MSIEECMETTDVIINEGLDLINDNVQLILITWKRAYENGKADLYEANKAISNLLDLLKEKENIIDAMAEQLTTPVHNKEWIIEYFEKEANNDR